MKITRLFHHGETPMVTAKFRDAITHELVDPDTATVSVYDPNDELKIDAAAMVKDTVGEYHYDVDTTPFTVFGEYKAFIDGVRDNRVSTEKTVFTVEPGVGD